MDHLDEVTGSTTDPRVPRVVVVTGASGFVGSHIVLQLLERGYVVRAVVRDVSREDKVGHLKVMGQQRPGRLEFAVADVMEVDQLAAAFAGAAAVVHTATVAKVFDFKDPWEETVNPSITGTRNVLEAIDQTPTVKKLVFTSSILAILTFDKPDDHVFDEQDWNTWSSVERGDPYGFGKTTAEKMVFKHSEGKHYTVSVINPGAVIGPCLCKQHTKASPVVVRNLIFRNPMFPYTMAFVDVREVARAHIEALERPEAAGQRYLLVGDEPADAITDLGRITQKVLPEYHTAGIPKVPTAIIKAMDVFPWFARLKGVSEFQRCLCLKRLRYSNAKAKEQLGIKFRSLEESVRQTALSMVEQGFVKASLRTTPPRDQCARCIFGPGVVERPGAVVHT